MESIDIRERTGPITNNDGIPYDYIIIMDAGSSGSRLYIYNWLNPKSLYDKTHKHKRSLQLVKRIDSDEDKHDVDDDDKDDDKDMENTKTGDYKLPQVRTRPSWRKKIKPGVSTFKDNPGKIGKDHIKMVLGRIEKIIPRSQQSRTPIFVHATAGMRLLKPGEQELILGNICKYIQKNYDFYLPDCASHINIIDGDVEGLYGWIALNYLMGSFDQPLMHDHGKNHSTYGLLDMGGASTQISFQPNSTEVAEHSNALFKVQMSSMGEYKPDLNYNVFSTSFLGYGIVELHKNYITSLRNTTSVGDGILNDPCLPKGLIEENNVSGVGNFTECMDMINPLLIKSEDSDSASCSTNKEEVSSCLLSSTIPSLDFDVDKFIGVSGYWDVISNMLGIDNISKYGNAYDYQSFYLETEKICETPWSDLSDYKDEYMKKATFGIVTQSDLTELCFKSSWILNVLHRGLGFPKIETSNSLVSKENITPFQVAERINGSEFSWTLGRAVLYASWENSKFLSDLNRDDDTTTQDVKIGYYHASSPNLFIYGGELEGIEPRPAWQNSELVPNHKISLNKKHYTSFFVIMILIFAIGYFLFGAKKRKMVYKTLKRYLLRISKKFMPVRGNYTKLSNNNNNNNTNNNNDVELDDMALQNEIDETFNISDDDDE